MRCKTGGGGSRADLGDSYGFSGKRREDEAVSKGFLGCELEEFGVGGCHGWLYGGFGFWLGLKIEVDNFLGDRQKMSQNACFGGQRTPSFCLAVS